MKKTLTLALLLMCAVGMNAQKSKVSEREIVGTWIMKSMQWEGEKKQVCGKKMGYTQFKFYGADGEYASAGIAITKEGKYVIMPQEYGKYSLKDGWYSEMGRKALKDAIILTDKNTYEGTWKNRHDVWKKTAMPDKLVKWIVTCCKMNQTPDDIQQLIQQNIFK